MQEFRNILSGEQNKVYTDHKNLTYTAFNIERVIQWRLILDEYSPESIYVQGSKNVAADAFSRLDIVDTPNPVTSQSNSIYPLQNILFLFGQLHIKFFKNYFLLLKIFITISTRKKIKF